MEDIAPKRTRVLVVDDEEPTRQVAERALQKGGYDVTAASNGHQALARVEQSPAPFDLYVLDIVMPAMTGIELAKHIRRRQPGAKVLYLTGYSDALFPSGKAMLSPNEAFLEKPSSVKGLLEAASLLLFGHIPASHPKTEDGSGG